MLPDGLGIKLVSAGDVCYYIGAVKRVADRLKRCFGYAWAGKDCCLDLAQLDTEATYLDKSVATACKEQIAMLVTAHEVACTEYAFVALFAAVVEGVADEDFGCKVGMVKITPTKLRTADPQFASLTIGPGHDALIDIECWETQLTTLDVSGCPGLQHLDVGITPTATLDLRNNKELRYLGIFKTALTGIDLSANAELRAIVATYSEALSTLDISANTKLDVLQIGGTAIKAVDLTANPSLAEAVKTEPLYGEGIAVFDFVETYDYGVKNRNMAQTYRLMIPEDARVTVGGTLAYKLNPVAIALDVPSTVVLYKGWTLQANALMAPGNADTKVTWKSSNKKVATVSSKGKITAKKLGTATITATTDNKLTAKVKIKVTVEPTKLKLNKTGTVKLKKGKKLQLKTKLTPKASAADLIWESSKPKVATVSSKGKVTAKKAGTTTITVKTINGLKAKVKIKVTK